MSGPAQAGRGLKLKADCQQGWASYRVLIQCFWYASGNKAVFPDATAFPNTSWVSAVTVRISNGNKTWPSASVCGYCQNPVVGNGGVVKVQYFMADVSLVSATGILVNRVFFLL